MVPPRLTFAIFAAAAALLLAAPVAQGAATRYAEPAGNGPAATCPLANPCDIQDAVEDASVVDGDVVLLTAGPYTLGTDQLVITDDITIEPVAGLPRQTLTSTYAMAGGAVNVDGFAPGAVLRRLLISHGGATGLPTGLNLSGATAEQVYVVSDGFIACAVISGTIRDSVCFLTAAAQSSAIGAVGISIGSMSATPIQSKIRNVTAISKEPNAPGVILSASLSANVSIDGRNVIAESPTFDVFASTGGSAVATITLSNSNYPTFDAAGAGGSVTPNTTSGNQAAPPLFTNFAGNNFAQAPASPTIDAGAADSLIGALDVDGNPRVVQGKAGCPNAVPDIGAYEAPAVTPLSSPSCTTAPTPTTPKCKKAKKRKKPKTAAKKKKKQKCKKKKKRKKRRV